MEDFEKVIRSTFMRLQVFGMNLGMEELLDAMRMYRVYAFQTEDDLKMLLCLLWCKSEADRLQMEREWKVGLSEKDTPVEIISPPVPPPQEIKPIHETMPQHGLPQSIEPADLEKVPSAEETLSVLPVRTPFHALDREDSIELRNFYPVSRRFMTYSWRQLQYELPIGPEIMLDIDATVDLAAKQGIFLQPVFRRQLINQSHLVLLLDYRGSMMPFHHYLREFVDTAVHESNIARVEIYYFSNLPNQKLFTNPGLTEWLDMETFLNSMDVHTSVLVISDAGAARRSRNIDRYLATKAFIDQVYLRTNQIAWINPIPRPRWRSTTAQFVARLIPMFQMDQDGMSNAMDVLRGASSA